MKKIIGNLFILLLSTPIFALSSANVNQTEFYPGEQIILTLSSDGDKVVFPLIDNIGGNNVLSTNNSQKITIVNSKYTKKTSRSYVFEPIKSLSIPAYVLVVDGVNKTTQPIEITFKKPTQNKEGRDYVFQIQVDRPEFFLGDEVNLQVTFKIKKSLSANQINLSLPEAKDLLFTKIGQTNSEDKSYNISVLTFKVKANNFGTFNIPNLVATIGNQNNNRLDDFFFTRQINQRKKIFSNHLTLTVKPLPDALKIFGNFTIKASVDKDKAKEGDAINLTVSISGNGNFEDIEKFNLNIDEATVFSDDAIFDSKNWQQKFAIVAGKNFVIPSLKLDYFDKITQTKKTISTQPININVNKKNNFITKKTKTKSSANFDNKIEDNYKLKYYYLLLGVVLGLLIGFFGTQSSNKKKQDKNKNLIKQIKSAKGNKQLFDLLLPLNLKEFEIILQQLESNVYKKAVHKINKKEIIAIVKKRLKVNQID